MIGTNSFRGEVPGLTPRALPDNAAQLALNARLQTGDLEAWRQFVQEKVLANASPVETIYKLFDKWLSWSDQVDVARGLIPGDETYRTFLTSPSLYSTPRFTNYALATTGAEPFPVTTRVLGVGEPQAVATLAQGIDPTPSSFSVDITDTGDSLATAWQTSGPVNEATFNSNVIQTGGRYQISWRDYETGTFMKRDFGIKDATAVTEEFTFALNNVSGISRFWAGVQRTEAGAGVSVMLYGNSGTWGLHLGTSTTWSQGQGQSTVASSASFAGISTGSPGAGPDYTMRIEMVTNLDNTTAVTATVLSGATVLATVSSTMSLQDKGGWCGFGSGEDQLGATNLAQFDDIHVQATGSTGYNPVNLATAYVWTYENDLAQESAPSRATAPILRPDGISVTVTMPTALPSGYSVYGITTKNVYRLVTGTGGTAYKFVGSVPLATADFVDDLPDEETGPRLLVSEDWDLPPDDLEGILPLPNGCMAGFFANQLCFSEPGFPHAWPVKYRKTADSKIVAIANIDTTIVIGTESVVQTATGTSPENYAMSQPGEKQACVSKLGMRFLDGLGVVFPSPDGYQLCRGSAGSVVNLTEKTFTRRQWQERNPETILAAVHDGVLHWFYNSTTLGKGGYALDARPNGFGLISLGYHATAAYSDALTDHLYLVLDDVDEPDDELLPITPAPVTANNLTIFRFDASPTVNMTYRWRGKLHLMDRPATLHFMRLRAAGYANLVANVYADGVLIDSFIVTDSNLTRLPGADSHDSYELELVGTSTVRSATAAQHPDGAL